MTETACQSDAVDRSLAALADPTRRQILDLLSQGPRALGDLARSFTVSRSAISQHVKVLKVSGLVVESKVGRSNIYAVDPAAGTRLSPLFGYVMTWQERLAAPVIEVGPDDEASGVGADEGDASRVDEVDWRAISAETDPQVTAVVARMFIVARSMEKLFASAAGHHGLNIGEVLILGTLHRLGRDCPCTPTQLGKSALTSLSGIAKRLGHLERLGLVERMADSQDRRSSRMRITDEGRSVFVAISRKQFGHNYASFSALPQQELAQLDHTLQFLLRSLPQVLRASN
ncbi:HTH-type transcriptional regulator [compost metagenome]